MPKQDFWLRVFEETGNSPATWRLVADELLIAADTLVGVYRGVDFTMLSAGTRVPKASRLLGPFLLLRAAAVEALLKGRAARRGHQFVAGGSFCPIPGTGNGHNLLLIAERTGFRLGPQERDLLDRLSPYLELGRYPIGKSWSLGLKTHPHPGVGSVRTLYYSTADDRVLAQAFGCGAGSEPDRCLETVLWRGANLDSVVCADGSRLLPGGLHCRRREARS